MRILIFLMVITFAFQTSAQFKRKKIFKDTSDLTYTGTKISPYDIDYDTTGKLSFSGYIDTYYAYYGDSVSNNGFSKFPTIAPRHNQFGLNILQFSAKYQSRSFRGIATLFAGDCPQSAWSTHLNYIQEANVGFKIYKKLWLDAGLFRTHIGLESIQPRENVTMGLAVTTYYEPYFLSGAKLTWQHSAKWMFQINAFNSFNHYIENNKSKVYGISTSYTPNKNWNVTFSSIVCDESPKDLPQNHFRWYNDLYLVYHTKRWIFGYELNAGLQTNSRLNDTTKTAYMLSSTLTSKYRITHQFALYGRIEMYTDPNEILTGPIQNQDHQLVGLDLFGTTLGVEFKPIPNSYLRMEGRYLMTKKNEDIFNYQNHYQNHRWEFIVGLGFWF